MCFNFALGFTVKFASCTLILDCISLLTMSHFMVYNQMLLEPGQVILGTDIALAADFAKMFRASNKF